MANTKEVGAVRHVSIEEDLGADGKCSNRVDEITTIYPREKSKHEQRIDARYQFYDRMGLLSEGSRDELHSNFDGKRRSDERNQWAPFQGEEGPLHRALPLG